MVGEGDRVHGTWRQDGLPYVAIEPDLCIRHRVFHDEVVTLRVSHQVDRASGYAAERAYFRRRLGSLLHPLGCPGRALDSRLAGVPGRSKPTFAAAFIRVAAPAGIARSTQSAGICRAHDAAHAVGDGAVAYLHLYIRDPGGAEQTGRAVADSATRHSAIGADSRLYLDHSRLLFGARARPRARGQIRRDFRDLHQPGLEHGLQLLSVA